MADSDHRIIKLPFGAGLSRSDGIMVRRPTDFEDIRNVHLYEGKAQARGGLLQTSVLQNDSPADIDQVNGLISLRSQQAAMAVGYDTAAEEVWLDILAIDGTGAAAVGLLADVSILNNGWAYAVPVFIMAESDTKMLIAHDEPNLGGRVPTKVYDALGAPVIDTLQADLDGGGLADVLFRGVTRHLAYIVGWGYGNASDANRPDVLRISDAGQPTIFQDFAFFEVGQRAERISVCRTAGTSLIVFKDTETYELFGYSPDTFGVRPIDTLFGCVGSRLAVSVGDTVYFWSTQGPRAITGGAKSVDLAVPLDIEGPDPATLVAESEPHDAFAEYDPKSRVVMFVWGRRVYALSIRNPSQPRWSYYELGETAQVGAQLFVTEGLSGGTAPTGYPDITLGSMVQKVGFESTAFTLTWDNIGDTAAALIQIYLSDDAGATYVLKKTVASTGAAGQTTDIEGLMVDTSYKVSLRAFRGASGTTPAVPAGVVDWTGDATDADNWDSAVFRGQATAATAEGIPEPVSRGANDGLWQKIGSIEEITVEWVNPLGTELLGIEVERQIRTEGLPFGVQNVDGRGIGPADTGTGVEFAWTPIITLPAGTTQWTDLVPHNFRWNDYRFRYVGGVTFSPILNCWGGPDAPQDDSLNPSGNPSSNFIFYEWSNAITPIGRTACPGPSNPPVGHSTELWYNDTIANPASDGWINGNTRPSGQIDGDVNVTPSPAADDTPVRCAIRHIVTCGGVQYPSYWSRVTATQNYVEVLSGMLE